MPTLTHVEAIARAAAIRVDAYDIDLDLTGGDRVFRSTSKINFTCTQPDTSTFLNVLPDAFLSITLDGAALDVAALDAGRYPLSGLEPGGHEIVVVADMAYTNAGQGLHRFVDPADGLAYLYGMAFLDAAPRIFGCFDQPDLKAPVTMRVTADPAWTLSANGAGTQVEPGRWEFETTKPLATYFVTLVAGPYHVVRSEHDGIPIGIFARTSIGPSLDEQAPEIFELTAACLDRFHELFGVRYPFGKYDHAFVPEFNEGAMENPGCVTYRDEYIFTSAVTDAEREERANVIAHEMAHMWFGDLVTMRWWDDLWLNESFAEYLGMRLTYEVTPYTGIWTSFALRGKAWGYAADQRPSTHPVAATVTDTDEALLNFDGISYAKGAAVLRQLVAWLGDDVFFAGLRAHFAKHAYGNATLADLLDVLSDASGRDLSEWARVWLRTPQVSTLRPDVTLDADGRYATVDVVQTSPSLAPGEAPVLRPHRINVATGMLGDDGLMRLGDVVEVEVDGARTRIDALAGVPAADLLLLNDSDLTYAKIRLDDASMARLATTLPSVRDGLTRALLWGAAWDATRDAELSADAFVDICAAGLPGEDVTLLPGVLTYVLALAIGRFLPVERRRAARARVHAACRSALDGSEPGSGRQLAAARGLIGSAGPDDLVWMVSWLDSADTPPDNDVRPPNGLVLDADFRWLIVQRLAVVGAASAADIDAEYERDRTAANAIFAAKAHASRPDAEAKEAAWTKIISDDSLSNHLLFATADGFWQADQEAITAPYVERFVADIPRMAERRAATVAEHLVRLVYPATAVDVASLAVLTAMTETGRLAPALRRLVDDGNDDLARALAARARAGS
jgi:aminopeptidase N